MINTHDKVMALQNASSLARQSVRDLNTIVRFLDLIGTYGDKRREMIDTYLDKSVESVINTLKDGM